MLTNMFFPAVSGVARSVESFSGEFRKMGHEVVVIAPQIGTNSQKKEGAVYLPSINLKEDFSLRVPVPAAVFKTLRGFRPDVVHTHHPFIIGSTAMKLAGRYGIPLVFTFHTLYEKYTHYIPGGDTESLKKYARIFSTEYADLCDRIFAPTQSVKELLISRGVKAPIDIVPTGLELDFYGKGDRKGLRERYGIPQEAFTAGFLSRIGPEKNVMFLAMAIARFLKRNKKAYFLVVGKGPSEKDMKEYFADQELSERVIFTGVLRDENIRDSYKAMDVFTFASKTETQGLVLTEALASGLPIVALDATGSRDAVEDGVNGFLVKEESSDAFSRAVSLMAALSAEERAALAEASLSKAHGYSIRNCAERALKGYLAAMESGAREKESKSFRLKDIFGIIKAEWDMIKNRVSAVDSVVFSQKKEEKE